MKREKRQKIVILIEKKGFGKILIYCKSRKTSINNMKTRIIIIKFLNQ